MNDVTRDGDFDAARGQRPARHDRPKDAPAPGPGPAPGSPLTPCGSLMSWLELRTSPSSYATDCSFSPRRISPGAVHFVIAKMRIVIIGIRIIKTQYTHFYFALVGLFQYLLIKWAAAAAHKSVLNWQL